VKKKDVSEKKTEEIDDKKADTKREGKKLKEQKAPSSPKAKKVCLVLNF